MGDWRAEMRRREATQRQNERDAKRRQREFERRVKEDERRLKEDAKLSALQQAQLEVEAYQNTLDVLLSIHKERSATIDWHSLAYEFKPHVPPRVERHHLAALTKQALNGLIPTSVDLSHLEEQGVSLDEQVYELAFSKFKEEMDQWEKSHSFAQDVLAGKPEAFGDVISEYSPLGEIARVGSSFCIRVHNAKFIVCELQVNGREVIPKEIKSLTASGKVSVKPMPKARFHEIYQDYVCGCVLRLVRELFALLPIEIVLVTANVETIDPHAGRNITLPVLSLAAPKTIIERLEFECIDPSDSLVKFQHRGEVLTSRKSEEFVPIVALTPADLPPVLSGDMDFMALVASVRELRNDYSRLLKSSIERSKGKSEQTGRAL